MSTSRTGRPKKPSTLVQSPEAKGEKLASLKKSQGGYAGDFTKKYNEFYEMVDKASPDDYFFVDGAFSNVKISYDKFVACIEECMHIANEVDPDSCQEYQQKLCDIDDKYQLATTKYGDYGRNREAHLQLQVSHHDSVSQASSHRSRRSSRVSSTTSARARAAAKKAALLAKAQSMGALREAEMEQLALQAEAECRKQEMERHQREIEREKERQRQEMEHQQQEMEREKEHQQQEMEREKERQRQEMERQQQEMEREKERQRQEMERQQQEMEREMERQQEEIEREKERQQQELVRKQKMTEIRINELKLKAEIEALDAEEKAFDDFLQGRHSNSSKVFENTQAAKQVSDVKLNLPMQIKDSATNEHSLYQNGASNIVNVNQDTSSMPNVSSNYVNVNHVDVAQPNVKMPVNVSGRNSRQVLGQYAKPELMPSMSRNVTMPSQPALQPIHMKTGPSYMEHYNVDSQAQLMIQRQMLDAIRLPKTTLKTFSGDPLEFWVFMNSFDSTVHKSDVEDGDKLNRLIEYCSGKAEKVIRPCAVMNPSEGYKSARQLLKERFGDNHVIANAWIKKIVDGSPIKPNNSEALQDLADDVVCCKQTLQAMRRLHEVESQDRMVKIVKRLPIYLQSRWRKEACVTKDQTGEYPDFNQFSMFLSRIAKEANDPVFGKLEANNKDFKGGASSKSNPQKKNINLSVQANTTETGKGASQSKSKKCLVCEGEHHTSECFKLKKMKPFERLEVAKSKKLCFNCMDFSNHWTRDCRRKTGCTVENCQKKHSTLLHDAFNESSKAKSATVQSTPQKHPESSKNEATVMTCTSLIAKASKCALPIVPVKVRGKGQNDYILTYAILDTASNRSFCSKTLLTKLGLFGQHEKLKIESLNEHSDIDTVKVEMEATSTVGKMKNHKIVQLPNVYAVENFVKLQSSMVVKDEVNNLEQFKGLPIPTKPGEVTLLIGNDVPDALKPREVRDGGDGQPYAVRTDLGWALNGPIDVNALESTAVCNFIRSTNPTAITLDAQVEKFWKIDTSQPSIDQEKTMSQEDKENQRPNNQAKAKKNVEEVSVVTGEDEIVGDLEIEEDNEELTNQDKRKRTSANNPQSSSEDSVIVIEEPTSRVHENIKQRDESEDIKNIEKTGRRMKKTRSQSDTSRKSLSSQCSQNRGNGLEMENIPTTPPKVTRSGRKVVAPNKDMPEPMTPPGNASQKGKTKSQESLTVSYVRDDVPKVTEKLNALSPKKAVPSVRRSVQKKITEMFVKEDADNQDSENEYESLPEMEDIDADSLHPVSDSENDDTTRDNEVSATKETPGEQALDQKHPESDVEVEKKRFSEDDLFDVSCVEIQPEIEEDKVENEDDSKNELEVEILNIETKIPQCSDGTNMNKVKVDDKAAQDADEDENDSDSCADVNKDEGNDQPLLSSNDTETDKSESDQVMPQSKELESQKNKENTFEEPQSSFENGQILDEELKEMEKEEIHSKEKSGDKLSADTVDTINNPKQQEEELSPEKPQRSKLSTAVGTPERQKKFGALKCAGSRAAMLVACAKQNMKNRGTSEGESPTKPMFASDNARSRLGGSPSRRSAPGRMSPANTPPNRKRKLIDSENGRPWVKHEPSPGASPSTSILKKPALEEVCNDTPSPPPSKQRRVSFADPPVSDRDTVQCNDKTC